MMPALFGLDMLTLFGLAIVGCGALGWLLGPAVGGALFRAMNRASMPGMTQVRSALSRLQNRTPPHPNTFRSPLRLAIMF